MISTTDANWVETFMKRDMTSIHAMIYKLATIKNCAIYWNIQSSSFQNSTTPLPVAMLQTIYTDENPHQSNNKYLLGVPNQLSVKFIHHENFPDNIPKLNIDINISILQFALDSSQYSQILMIMKNMNNYDVRRQIFLLRPNNAVKSHAKEWWHYAYNIIVRGKGRTKNQVSFI